MVTCKNCGRGYAAIFEEYDQGVDCAAELYTLNGTHYIQGFYGSSRHDGRVYKLKDGVAYKTGVICDDCIDKLQDCFIDEEEVRYF